MTAANELPVDGFRQILTWPLMLRPESGNATPDTPRTVAAVAREVEASQTWETVPDPLDHIPADSAGSHATDSYSEFVYFQPFVQRVLFGASAESNREDHQNLVRLFRRTDLIGLRARMEPEPGTHLSFIFMVERANLYLLSTGIAVVVCELVFPAHGMVEVHDDDGQPLDSRPLTLADVQLVLDRLRRTYPPFFDQESGRPGRVADLVEWLTANGEVLRFSPPTAYEGVAQVMARRHPPVAGHWRHLVAPLEIEGYTSGEASSAVWRHVVDDRIPVLVGVSVPNPHDIERGDWMRLCHGYGPGRSSLFAETFTTGFESNHCYDRFWEPSRPHSSTRFVMSGPVFTQVRSSKDRFGDELQMHLRRHYFQIGLLVQVQFSTLLRFMDWLSAAVARRGLDDPGFHLEVRAIQQELMRFSHSFWFPLVSNHAQGRELFEMWQRHLKVERLFDLVTAKARTINEVLDVTEEQRLADAAGKLSVFSAVGVILGLPMSFLSMNVLVEGQSWPMSLQVAVLLLVFGGAMLFGAGFTHFASRPFHINTVLPRLRLAGLSTGLFCWLLAAVLAIWYVWAPN